MSVNSLRKRMKLGLKYRNLRLFNHRKFLVLGPEPEILVIKLAENRLFLVQERVLRLLENRRRPL